MGDMTTLRNNYKLCKTELSNMKRDQSSKRVTRSMSKKIKDESEVDDDPRKALFAAIHSLGSKEENPKSTDSADPREALFAAIKNRTKEETSDKDGDNSSPPSDVKHSPVVHRLSKFLTRSKLSLSLGEKDQDAAIRACKVCSLSIVSLHFIK